jgi:tetratricopeptide (TPR) repeat protein
MNEQSRNYDQLLKDGKYEEARQVLTEALQTEPEDCSLLSAMGLTLRHQRDYLASSGFYRQALAVEPTNPDALCGFGDALRGLKQYEAAIESWKKYLHVKDLQDIYVLTRIADCYKNLRNFEESRSYYLQVLALKPQNRYGLIGLADLYHKQGMEAQAIEFYEKALENGVTLINILTIVGNLHYRQGNYEKARGYYERTLAQEPENAYALFGLGNYYRWKSDYRRSIELWESIKEVNSSTSNMLTRLGDAYRNIGQFEAAEQTYKKNMALGYNKFSFIGLIKLHCIQLQMKEACSFYDELLKHEHGEDRKVFSEVCDMFIKRNKPELAREFLRHSLDRQKDNRNISRIIEDRLRQLG